MQSSETLLKDMINLITYSYIFIVLKGYKVCSKLTFPYVFVSYLEIKTSLLLSKWRHVKLINSCHSPQGQTIDDIAIYEQNKSTSAMYAHFLVLNQLLIISLFAYINVPWQTGSGLSVDSVRLYPSQQ